jgi:hypothetical protein
VGVHIDIMKLYPGDNCFFTSIQPWPTLEIIASSNAIHAKRAISGAALRARCVVLDFRQLVYYALFCLPIILFLSISPSL